MSKVICFRHPRAAGILAAHEYLGSRERLVEARRRRRVRRAIVAGVLADVGLFVAVVIAAGAVLR